MTSPARHDLETGPPGSPQTHRPRIGGSTTDQTYAPGPVTFRAPRPSRRGYAHAGVSGEQNSASNSPLNGSATELGDFRRAQRPKSTHPSPTSKRGDLQAGRTQPPHPAGPLRAWRPPNAERRTPNAGHQTPDTGRPNRHAPKVSTAPGNFRSARQEHPTPEIPTHRGSAPTVQISGPLATPNPHTPRSVGTWGALDTPDPHTSQIRTDRGDSRRADAPKPTQQWSTSNAGIPGVQDAQTTPHTADRH